MAFSIQLPIFHMSFDLGIHVLRGKARLCLQVQYKYSKPLLGYPIRSDPCYWILAGSEDKARIAMCVRLMRGKKYLRTSWSFGRAQETSPR
ncbi:hypothetical protein ABKN59_006241 [Abortiporus biennis]